MAETDTYLMTENEGSLMSLVLRSQPVTAYQLIRMYEESPVASYNVSKGGVYPLVGRLKERGYLTAERVAGDKRNTETLVCTDAGREALRRWTTHLNDSHILLADPMRTRIMTLNLLSRDAQLRWIVAARELIARRKAHLVEFGRKVDVPFQEIIQAAHEAELDGQLATLDKLLAIVVREAEAA